MGSGTTAAASNNLKRQFIGFELNQNYYEKSLERLAEISPNSSKKTRSQAMPLFETL
jgi:DNA modification methylase